MKKIIILLCAIVFFFGCKNNKENSETNEDQYLWLEEVESDTALDWVKAQNKIAKEALTNNDLYNEMKVKFLEALNNKDKIAYPTVVGDYVYNLWQDENHVRGIWRRMLKSEYLESKENWELVLDIDSLSEAENKKWVFSGADWLEPDNTICLLNLSDGGKDEHVIREFNAETKTFAENGFTLEESKGGANWINENTLLISRDFGEGTLTTSGYPRFVKILNRGETVANAENVFEIDSVKTGVFPMSFYSGNRYYSFIYKLNAFYNSELHYLKNDEFIRLDYPIDAEFSGFFNNQLILSLQSDWNVNDKVFKAGTLVSFDLDEFLSGKKDIKTIYEPDSKSSFGSLVSSSNFIILNVMENVQNKLIKCIFTEGEWKKEILDTPEFGSIFLLGSGEKSNDFFFTYSNLIKPTTLYYGTENTIKQVKQLKEYFNSENLKIDQYETKSKDGTLIPYFIVHHKDIELNGKNPVLIYAYGGFNVSEQPNYSFTRGIGWLEQGGVYVLANIRGGGEFGPSWHKAALKEKRQNAYDDFFAVSEDIIERKVSSPEYMSAYGWSNGGLLAGVVLTQRPDLYGAVLVGAPLLDMKRYTKLLAGASWIGEYGDPDIPEEWEYIKEYSPYHNVYKEKTYPEVLFVTSTKDDRVHPGHARKMAAKMLDMGHNIYYHETIEGGHGAASTNDQRAEMYATMYTFLNMKLKNK